MARTKLFRSNRSQAVRLARDVAFPDSVRDVTVLRDRRSRLIMPADSLWDDLFDGPGATIGDRDQPEPQVHDPF